MKINEDGFSVVFYGNNPLPLIKRAICKMLHCTIKSSFPETRPFNLSKLGRRDYKLRSLLNRAFPLR